MPPSPTLTTRPALISELAAAAAAEASPPFNRDLKHYLRLAEDQRKAGIAYMKRASGSANAESVGLDMERAFIALAEAGTLVVETIPAHRDYGSELNEEQRQNLMANGHDILDNLGRLKTRLVDRYERYIHSGAANPDAVPAFKAAAQHHQQQRSQHSLAKEVTVNEFVHTVQQHTQKGAAVWDVGLGSQKPAPAVEGAGTEHNSSTSAAAYASGLGSASAYGGGASRAGTGYGGGGDLRYLYSVSQAEVAATAQVAGVPAPMPVPVSLERGGNQNNVILNGTGPAVGDEPCPDSEIYNQLAGRLAHSVSLGEVPDPPRPLLVHIGGFLFHWERRGQLSSQSWPSLEVRAALENAELQICTYLARILESQDALFEVVLLKGHRAQSFLDAIQHVLDRGSLPNATFSAKARRLMRKLSEAWNQLPASLVITGVYETDNHPTFTGGFGDVYLAWYGGKRVALKRIRTFAANSTANNRCSILYREALIWRGLRHQNILPFLGIDRETFPLSFCLVSPWMKNGTIVKFLKAGGQAEADRLILEITQGLEYLHATNIVHGDLRGNNILISDDYHACLSDFGLTTTFDEAETAGALTSSSNRAGSVRWFAPELISPQQFGCPRFTRTPATDVYAFACVCLELETGAPPFATINEAAAMLKVIAGERPERPGTMSRKMWDLVSAAWAQDAQLRPTISETILALQML